MLFHWFLAAIHLLAVALGLWAVLIRGTALSRLAVGTAQVRNVLVADNVWGVCAGILLITGLMRAFHQAGDITGHNAGRRQRFAGNDEQRFVIHRWVDDEIGAGLSGRYRRQNGRSPRTEHMNRSTPTLVLLPGMDGTGELFAGNRSTALPASGCA